MTVNNLILLLRALIFVGVVSVQTACTVMGPDYVPPSMDVPASYKEVAELPAQTPDVSVHARWWTLFGDQQLNALMALLQTHNYSVQAADARMRQARSLSEIAQLSRFPTLVAGGTNDFGLLANWEIDLWGRIRRSIEASGATAQASAADLAAVTLSLQAQLAQNYLQLRIQDADVRVLQETVADDERALQITRNQYAMGLVDQAAVAKAQAQLAAAQAQHADARLTRAQLEHAIAVLIGKAPADFSLASEPTPIAVPSIPTALPASLLKQRPDIAAAERRVAAASAQIGVAEAATYPALDLFAGVSIRRGLLGGAKVVAPLLYGETAQAGSARASAAYDESVAQYRQTVLNGLRDVEDALAATHLLEQASSAQDAALQAARKAVSITENQYRAGVVNYQSVIVSRATALTHERAALGIHGRRLAASLSLIKALGSGWTPEASPLAATTNP